MVGFPSSSKRATSVQIGYSSKREELLRTNAHKRRGILEATMIRRLFASLMLMAWVGRLAVLLRLMATITSSVAR